MTEDSMRTASSSSVSRLLLGLIVMTPNAWTIVTICRTPSLRTASNIYIVSLAVADLLTGVFPAVYEIGAYVGYQTWFVENKLACLALFAAMFVSVSVSLTTSSLVAIDRYLYISRPFLHKRVVTRRRVVLSMLPLWALATVLAALMSVLKNSDETVACKRNTGTKTDVFFVLPLYITCCVIAGTMYALISQTALRHMNRIADLTPPEASNGLDWHPQEELARRLQSAKMFLVVFGAFFLCVTPFVVVHAVHRLVTPVPQGVQNGVLLLFLVNSLLNPPLYLAFNAEFRRAFTQCCCCCCLQTRVDRETPVELA